MKNFLNGLIYGISYFTIIPVKLNYFDANKTFYKGVLFSLILSGFLLALIISVAHILLSYIMPTWYSAYFVAIIYMFLYGFLHLEAFADTIDAWYASFSNKDIYKVMHEPQIGSIGAIGTFSFVLLKVLALGYLLSNEHFIYIIITLILSRFSVFFALDLNFHEKSKFILSLKNSYKASVLLKIIFLPINILSKYILKTLQKRLGFLNGDTLGFSIELIELILLNIFIILT